MAITYLEEIWKPRRYKINYKGERTHDRSWKVRVDTPVDDPLSISFDPRFPPLGGYYVGKNGFYDLGSTLREYEAEEQDDDPCEYIIIAHYSNARDQERTPDNPFDYQSGGSGGGGQGDPLEADPLQDPPMVRYDQTWIRRAMVKDYSDPPKFVVNQAGEQYDPPPEEEVAIKVIVIEKNKATDQQDLADSHGNHCNDAIITIAGRSYAKGEALLRGLRSETMQRGTIFFWKCTYEVHIWKKSTIEGQPPGGWDETDVLEQGTYWIDQTTGARRAFEDKSGNSLPTGLLDEDGAKLPDAVPAEDPVYTRYQFKGYEDFDDLNLP